MAYESMNIGLYSVEYITKPSRFHSKLSAFELFWSLDPF